MQSGEPRAALGGELSHLSEFLFQSATAAYAGRTVPPEVTTGLETCSSASGLRCLT